jgi:hypothetical protein
MVGLAMSPTETRGSVVVVGVDGIGTADDALDWAAAEAAARGCRLRIVHAFRPPLLVDPYGVVPAIGDDLRLLWAGVEQVLAYAVARVRSVAPDLPVTPACCRPQPFLPCSARPVTPACSCWATAACGDYGAG